MLIMAAHPMDPCVDFSHVRLLVVRWAQYGGVSFVCGPLYVEVKIYADELWAHIEGEAQKGSW